MRAGPCSLAVVLAASACATAGGGRQEDGAGEPAERPWAVSAYAGKWSDNRFVEILQGETELRDSHLVALAVGREVARPWEPLSVEAEVQAVRHFGRQGHLEFNGCVFGRWHRFPWDPLLPTSVAYGIGPSFATRRPPIEDRSPERPASRHHLFMLGEVAVTAPGDPPVEVFLRIHHRSGVFGLVSDARGSNFLTGGIRVRF